MEPDGNSNDIYSEKSHKADWIVTFADLMTLLLVFFVLLYSISTLNLEKFKNAIKSIQVSLGETNPRIGLLDLVNVPEAKDMNFVIENLTGLRSREQEMIKTINEFIDGKNQSENIIVYSKAGKIIIQVRGKVLFGSGSAKFNEAAIPILDEIIDIIQTYPEYNVNIKGHTDDIPISNKQYPSNWELSAIRATTVLKHLISGGVDPLRLTATGYAELFPIVPNDTPENRARNRRVEFVLEKKTER
ncbi:MAG: OmpA family protein [Deltaproteobacteria bacterium]|nr:OmpA family protein [Deltaproteobacteria bacterium]